MEALNKQFKYQLEAKEQENKDKVETTSQLKESKNELKSNKSPN